MPDIAALETLLRQRAADPFAWGTRDCATLVFDAVHAMTGTDPAAAIRGRWDSAISAARVFNACGGWEGMAERGWFGEPIGTDDLRDGDVVLVEAAHCGGLMAVAGSLGVVFLGHILLQGEADVRALPLTAAASAWRLA
jgi:hypothetical protein